MVRGDREDGFALAVLLVMVIPMLLVVGAFAISMTGKGSELRTEIDNEQALLAAEAGVDDAIYRGELGTLLDGVPYQRSVGRSMNFSVTPTHLLFDGIDNDNDGSIDEADEDVYQVVVTGTYRKSRRRVAAYLGPVPLLPTIQTAIGIQNPSPTIVLQGTPDVLGQDIKMNGTPGAGLVPALSIATPQTTAVLLAELSAGEQSHVVGAGGSPSLGTMPPVDLVTLAAQLQNAANIVLTANQYSSYSFGNGPGNVANITYRNGTVRFAGNSQGAGVLVVTGDLDMKGNFRFDGVIIVLGNLDNSAGTADVYGAVLLAGGTLNLRGSSKIQYSSEAINLANSTSGRYVAFNGWQELGR